MDSIKMNPVMSFSPLGQAFQNIRIEGRSDGCRVRYMLQTKKF